MIADLREVAREDRLGRRRTGRSVPPRWATRARPEARRRGCQDVLRAANGAERRLGVGVVRRRDVEARRACGRRRRTRRPPSATSLAGLAAEAQRDEDVVGAGAKVAESDPRLVGELARTSPRSRARASFASVVPARLSGNERRVGPRSSKWVASAVEGEREVEGRADRDAPARARRRLPSRRRRRQRPRLGIGGRELVEVVADHPDRRGRALGVAAGGGRRRGHRVEPARGAGSRRRRRRGPLATWSLRRRRGRPSPRGTRCRSRHLRDRRRRAGRGTSLARRQAVGRRRGRGAPRSRSARRARVARRSPSAISPSWTEGRKPVGQHAVALGRHEAGDAARRPRSPRASCIVRAGAGRARPARGGRRRARRR